VKNLIVALSVLGLAGLSSIAAATTQTLSVRISLGTDDMERRIASGTPELDIDSSDLEIGDDGGSRPNTIGLRFQNVGLPATATVLSAFVQFTGDAGDVASDLGTPSVVIHGQRSVNPATFSIVNVDDIISRTSTTATINWNSIPTWGPNAAGANERTPDLKPIVDEIIGLPGWTSGNAMAFVFSQDAGDERTAHAFEGQPTQAAQLIINYVAPASAASWELYE
jgi:hypothetical protein